MLRKKLAALSHPQAGASSRNQVTQPANPAQVTDARYDSVALAAAREIMTLTQSGAFDDHLKAKIQVRIIEAITAAIGAGGQAVGFASRQSGLSDFDVNGAEIINALLYPKGTLRPENEIPLYAHPTPSGQAVADDDTLETIERELIDGLEVEINIGCESYTFNHRQLATRILSALSQPHPADERVVEAPFGWVYFNEDAGTEWSENHPVTSGEVSDAKNIRPCAENEKLWIDELRLRDDQLFHLRAERATARNYVADEDTYPKKITFADGRIVRLMTDNGVNYLDVGFTAALSAKEGRS